MTLAVFGKATPIQCDMLGLVGWHLSRGQSYIIADKAKRVHAMCKSHLMLVYRTRQDYGFELSEWREFLMLPGDDFGYMHPYSFEQIDDEIVRAIKAPEYVGLAAVAEEAAQLNMFDDQEYKQLLKMVQEVTASKKG